MPRPKSSRFKKPTIWPFKWGTVCSCTILGSLLNWWNPTSVFEVFDSKISQLYNDLWIYNIIIKLQTNPVYLYFVFLLPLFMIPRCSSLGTTTTSRKHSNNLSIVHVHSHQIKGYKNPEVKNLKIENLQSKILASNETSQTKMR